MHLLLLILNVQLKQQNDLDKTMVFKAACDWLIANDISGVAYDGNPLSKLAKVMPTVDPDLVQEKLYGKHI